MVPELFDSLTSEMLRLRQACCHPQIGTHGIQGMKNTKTLSMNEIHDQIIKNKSKVCTGHLRWKLLGMNGIAGLLLLQQQHKKAIEQYRKVLQVVQDMTVEFKVDKYQELHAIHNLLDITTTSSSNSNSTTTRVFDSNERIVLQTRLKEIREKEKRQFENDVVVVQLKVQGHVQKIQTIEQVAVQCRLP